MVLLVVYKIISKRVDEGDEVDVGLNQLCFGNRPIAPSPKNYPQHVNTNSSGEYKLCRRQWLLNYFDLSCAKPGEDPNKFCDICSRTLINILTLAPPVELNVPPVCLYIYVHHFGPVGGPTLRANIKQA